MRGKRLTILVAMLAVFGAAGAYAFFTTTGAGAAQAGSGTLSAPSITAATPGAGTVALTWSAVTPPAAGTVTYYVSRDGGLPGGDCATSTSPAAPTSCTDSGVAAGSHNYTVTAVWRSWTATSSSSAVSVASGAATRLVLSAATTTPTAGAPDNLTITAKDAANNTVTSYTGDKSLTFGGPGIAPDGTHPTVSDKTGAAKDFGAATTIAFTSGVAAVSGATNGVMRLYKAGAATVTVSDGSIGDSGLGVTVAPASAASLSVSGYPASTVAGASHTFDVTARDAFGNTATGYTGTVAFSASGDSQAVLPIASTLSSGTGTFSATFKTVAGGSKTLTATDTVTSITGSQSGIAVSAASAAALSVSGYPASTVAGVSHSFAVTARDGFGNTATGYSGTVAFSASGDSQAVLPGNAALSSGTGVFSATFKTVAGGTKTLTATDTVTPAMTGSQSGIAVTPASAASFSVSGYPASTVAGVSHPFDVTARDAFGNTATGYTGTVAFSASNDAAATLPANTTLTAGAGTFSATFKTVAGGTKTLTATDTVTSSITGSQSGISVTPASAATIAIVSGGGQSAPVTTAFANPLVASVSDAFGNAVSGVPVTFAAPLSGAGGTFASTGCTSNSPTSQCVATTAANGTATSSTFTANATAGSYNVSASASGTNTTNFSLTNTTLDTFQVVVATPQTAGTPFTASITAKSGSTTDTSYTGTKCVTFSGPPNSPTPSDRAPDYPAQGSCATGQSAVSFSAGVATTPNMTLYRAAASTTLTATDGAITGTSAAFAVNSAGVALSYSPPCPALPVAKGSTTGFTIVVPTDAFSNPFTRNAPMGIGLTLSPANAGFVFATNSLATTTVAITTGPANNTFAVVAPTGAKKSATLSATAPTGFTVPADCTISTP